VFDPLLSVIIISILVISNEVSTTPEIGNSIILLTVLSIGSISSPKVKLSAEEIVKV